VTKTYRGALVLALVGALLVPAATAATATAATVPVGVTKGLDYLHTRQRLDGGFSYSSASGSTTSTPWIMLAIAAGKNNPSRWRSGGHSPVSFLQNTALDTAAKNFGNVPEYYALCILAYRAAGRTDLLSNAGSTQIDLIAKLESYQSLSSGYYAPDPTATTRATETTAWAVLALVAAHQSGPPLSDALTWLTSGGNPPNADNGFGSSPRTASSVTDTSLVLQALRAGKVAAGDSLVQGGATFIKTTQTGGGGFADTPGGFVSAPATAWAIQAMWVAGIDPHRLTQGVHTPYTFLRSLRHRNGSTYEFPGVGNPGDVLDATTQATIALNDRTTLSLPIVPGSKVIHYDPTIVRRSLAPKGGARIASHTVVIEASYHDNVHGTGIQVAAVRVTVDGRSRTKAASISASHLRLQLTKVADGSHTYVITVHDWAGNGARIQRSFTVAVPTGGGSTGGGTHPGGGTGNTGSGGGSGGSSTSGGTTHPPTPHPSATISPSQSVTPGITLTPTPSGSFPASSSSSSPSAIVGQVAGSGGGGGGGGHTAAVVGATLAVLVPIGFAGSWLVRRRLLSVMDGATRGEVLPQGTTVWQRFWKSSGGPPPGGSGE